jgi:hypothetical protein
MEQVKKQTAVEWLYTKLATCSSDELIGNINNWFDQAKAMEKEQIEDAYNEGYSIRDCNGDLSTNPSGSQYYINTYTNTDTP